MAPAMPPKKSSNNELATAISLSTDLAALLPQVVKKIQAVEEREEAVAAKEKELLTKEKELLAKEKELAERERKNAAVEKQILMRERAKEKGAEKQKAQPPAAPAAPEVLIDPALLARATAAALLKVS